MSYTLNKSLKQSHPLPHFTTENHCAKWNYRDKPTTQKIQGSFLNQKLKIGVQFKEKFKQKEEGDQSHRAKKLKTKHTKVHVIPSGITAWSKCLGSWLGHSKWEKTTLESEFGITFWQALTKEFDFIWQEIWSMRWILRRVTWTDY